MSGWFTRTWRRWKRRKSPVVSVERFEAAFSASAEHTSCTFLLAKEAKPEMSYALVHHNLNRFVGLQPHLLDNPPRIQITRAGPCDDDLIATATVVELNPIIATLDSEEE